MPAADDSVRVALDIYCKLAEQLNQLIEGRKAVPRELVKNTALAVAGLLRAYCLPGNWRGGYGSAPVTPLPPHLAAHLARQIEIVCSGHIPPWVLHLQRRGAVPADPKIRTAQGMAVAYVKLCKNGSIANKSPVTDVAKAFGVTRRAVQNWISTLDAEPSDFFPEATSDNDRAKLIAARMLECAEKYRTWGPGPHNKHPFGKGRKRQRAKR